MPASPTPQTITPMSMAGTYDPHAENLEDRTLAALAHVVDNSEGGEWREGQAEMAAAVALAIQERRHQSIEAPTGVGKGYAYLIPSICAGGTTIVSTATKTLQNQLSEKDLPQLAELIAPLGYDIDWAVLKGRNSYLCEARLAERWGDGWRAQENEGEDAAIQPGLYDQQILAADQTRSAPGQVKAELGALAGVSLLTHSTEVQIRRWATGKLEPGHPNDGDRDHMPVAVTDDDWRELSVTSRECPGRSRCAYGETCYAFAAIDRAHIQARATRDAPQTPQRRRANIVIVNHALLVAHFSTGAKLLPEADRIIIDEAHRLEDTIIDGYSVALHPGRWAALVADTKRMLTGQTAAETSDGLRQAARELEQAIAAIGEKRLRHRPARDGEPGGPGPETLQLRPAIEAGGKALNGLLAETRRMCERLRQAGNRTQLGEYERLQQRIETLIEEARRGWQGPDSEHVAWIESGAYVIAPVWVGDIWQAGVAAHVPTILCSATMTIAGDHTPTLRRLGYDPYGAENERWDPQVWDLESESGEDGDEPGGEETAGEPEPERREPRVRIGRDNIGVLSVDSPFDYQNQALLYIGHELGDPRTEEWQEKADAAVAELVDAAGGRALILTTSWAAVERFAERLRDEARARRWGHTLLVQGEASKAYLVDTFRDDETSVLVATMGFWEGLDVPGRSLSLVVVDKLPFPRPDDPIWQAKRERVEMEGRRAFFEIDLPRAATLTAQAVGRLIRTEQDSGVAALLDGRVGTRSYGQAILESLPPMRQSWSIEEACDHLRWISAA